MAITRLIAQYVPPEAIHVYSVDESFVDLTGTEQLWGSPEQVAKLIQEDIYEKFRIPSAIGMGPNMLMAKLALDLEAKNRLCQMDLCRCANKALARTSVV